MGILSLLKGKRLESLGRAREKGYEIDYSKPSGDKCEICGHKLYFAKDSYNGHPIADIVICSHCGLAYQLVPLLILATGKKEKEKEKELLRY